MRNNASHRSPGASTGSLSSAGTAFRTLRLKLLLQRNFSKRLLFARFSKEITCFGRRKAVVSNERKKGGALDGSSIFASFRSKNASLTGSLLRHSSHNSIRGHENAGIQISKTRTPAPCSHTTTCTRAAHTAEGTTRHTSTLPDASVRLENQPDLRRSMARSPQQQSRRPAPRGLPTPDQVRVG